MSTIFNVRNLKLPGVSRASVIIGALVVVLALVAAHRRLEPVQEADHQHRRRLLPRDAGAVSRRQGADHGRQGRRDRQDRAGGRQDEGDVPLRQQVTRCLPTPPRRSSTRAWWRRATSSCRRRTPADPVMEDNAVIPIDRTQVPVEYDELRDSINRILTDLGPTPEQPKGPFGDIIESAANGFAGKGEQLNKTLNGLSRSALHPQRGPRRLLRRDQESGAVRQRALPERSAVRRAQQRPRHVHQLVHQHRP